MLLLLYSTIYLIRAKYRLNYACHTRGLVLPCPVSKAVQRNYNVEGNRFSVVLCDTEAHGTM